MAGEDAADGLVLPVGLTEQQMLQQIARLETRLLKFEKGTTQRFKKNNTEIAQSFSGMSRQSVASLQNVSYQLQDIFVQIQGGQGAVRALSQQMPQLLSGFGLFGAAAGLATSLLVPLAASIFQTVDASEQLEDALDDMNGAVDAFAKAAANANTSMAELIEKYGRMAESAQVFLEAVEGMERVKAAEAIGATVSALTEGLLAMQRFADDGTEDWSLLAEALGVTEQASYRIANLMSNLAYAKGPEEQAKWARILAGALEDATGGYANMNGRARQVYEATVQIGNQTAEVVAITDKLPGLLAAAAAAADAAAAAVGGIGAAASASYGAVSSLVGKMWEMAQARQATNQQLDQMKFEFSPGGQAQLKYGGRGAPSSDQESLGKTYDMFGNVIPEKTRGSGGGGGGGGGRGNAELDSLIESLKTEREILEEWYAESLALLNGASEAELEALGGKHEAMERLEQEHQDRMAEIKEEANRFSLEMALGAGADVLAAMGSFNKKALKVSQAFAAAEALVSTYKGAAKALEKGAFGFAEAAAVIAKGLAFVGAIKGVNEGGGGGYSSGGTAASAAPPLPVQRIDIFAQGSTDFMAGMQSLIDTLSAAASRGLRVDPRLVAA